MSINQDQLTIIGAKTHNLKNISITLPKFKLVVFTGPSGSGKSSLAFDTIFVEGQRRYFESLSISAKYYLEKHSTPDVDSISGLSPTIALEQNTINTSTRSTVGTTTEIYHFLKLLFTKIGKPHCPVSNIPLKKSSPVDVYNHLTKHPDQSKIVIAAFQGIGDSEFLNSVAIKATNLGYSRILIDNEIFEVNATHDIKVTKAKISIVTDRVVLSPDKRSRIISSVEQSYKIGSNRIFVLIDDSILFFSNRLISPTTLLEYDDIQLKHFSSNSSYGACSTCFGAGVYPLLSEDGLIFDKTLNINQGAIPLLLKLPESIKAICLEFLSKHNVLPSQKLSTYPKNVLNALLFGDQESTFVGLKQHIINERLHLKNEYGHLFTFSSCPMCNGKKLNQLALNVRVENKDIVDLTRLPLTEFKSFISQLVFSGEELIIAAPIIKEIMNRTNFLIDIGLTYIALERPLSTLSGGENQRVQLATQLGAGLSGIIYVLDEPTIGLHPSDNAKLLSLLKNLVSNGNSVIIVEHDKELILSADHIVDIGLGSGINGGNIIFSGSPKTLIDKTESLTATYLNDRPKISINTINYDKSISIKGATLHNLHNLDVTIPVNSLTTITGVSGSGKTSLIYGVLAQAFKNKLSKNKNKVVTINYDSVTGIEHFKQIVDLDKTSLPRSNSSNVITYLGLFDEIRDIFAQTFESKARGYTASRFLFTGGDGVCESCLGSGVKKVDMAFLSDLNIVCDTCEGKRYNPETLAINYKGRNIAEILNLNISEANEHFKNYDKLSRVFKQLVELGLDYLTLGQKTSSLSGGEVQRLKLSKELAKRTTGAALYLFDEPTTGLHFNEIQTLINTFKSLTQKGHTVIVIEHNLDLIINSDYIIDMGPAGGPDGGKVLFSGKVHDLIHNKESKTAQAVEKYVQI